MCTACSHYDRSALCNLNMESVHTVSRVQDGVSAKTHRLLGKILAARSRYHTVTNSLCATELDLRRVLSHQTLQNRCRARVREYQCDVAVAGASRYCGWMRYPSFDADTCALNTTRLDLTTAMAAGQIDVASVVQRTLAGEKPGIVLEIIDSCPAGP